jgi:hypothetical protein
VGFGFVTIAAATAASGPSWTDIVTAIRTVLAGLAPQLAFIQLGALRQDRLRGQVSKVGAWVDTVEQQNEETGSWTIPVLIRNGSELPVKVDNLDLTIRAWGHNRVLAAPEITEGSGTTQIRSWARATGGISRRERSHRGTPGARV